MNKKRGGEKEVRLLENMKTKILAIASTILLAILLPVGLVFAHGGDSGASENSGPGNAEDVEVAEVDNSGPSENSGPGNVNELQVEEADDVDAEDVDGLEINDENEFEITGAVSSISGNTFVIDGQTIVIDPAMVDEFEQETDLTVGATVKTEGMVIDGTMFAEEIETP